MFELATGSPLHTAIDLVRAARQVLDKSPRPVPAAAAGASRRCVADAEAMVMAATGCQHRSVGWDERVASRMGGDHQQQRGPIFINVGANKGFNAAAFMSLWRDEVTEEGWKQLIERYAAEHQLDFLRHHPCGECNRHCLFGNKDGAQGKRRLPRLVGAEAHMLELQQSNRQLRSKPTQACRLRCGMSRPCSRRRPHGSRRGSWPR